MRSIIMRGILTSVLLLPLVGCDSLFGPEGYFRDRKDDYVAAETLPPTQLPEGVQSDTMSELYVIPPIADEDNELHYRNDRFVVPRPLPQRDKRVRNEVRIQKLAERRWIVINATPTQVWPRILAYLDTSRIPIAYNDAPNGILETAWLLLENEPSTKDRYRIRVEQGLNASSSEVHVQQLTVPRNTPTGGQINWPQQSVKAEKEAWMINQLAASLAQEQESSASLLAQAIDADRKVEVNKSGEEPRLDIKVDFKRAWASLGAALVKGGFSVESYDYAKGVYNIQFVEAKELAFAGDQSATRPVEDEDFMTKLFMTDEEEQARRDSQKVESYTLHVLEDEVAGQPVASVFLRTIDDKPADRERAVMILKMLRKHLG